MNIWEAFEQDCTTYLNKQFGNFATFTHQGGADSTTPDIFVATTSGKRFFMEAKHCPAQCGQFVLHPNLSSRKFEYSHLNINTLNEFSHIIIQHMNRDFEAFCNAGTKGKDIYFEGCEEIFAKWIIQANEAKGVKFFISNCFTILKLEDFNKYFSISAKYRTKKSGSSDVGKNRHNSVLSYIVSNHMPILQSRIDGDKLFITSSINLNNQKFFVNNNEYMFSKRENEYEIRKLSKTKNANVIFSITKKDVIGISENEFIDYLK